MFLFKKKTSIKLPEGFTVTGHSGCEGTPENSESSIRAGGENADITEFDLNFDSDGAPVLSHDAPRGACLALESAFEILSEYENLRANVDVKSTKNLSDVEPLAEKCGVLDRIFFTGINESDVEKVRIDCPKIEYYLNVNDIKKLRLRDGKYLLSLAEKVKKSGAVGINLNKSNVSKALTDIFHENGLLVSVWTVDKESDMNKILSFAPDNITTRYPSKLKKIIGEKSR